MEAFYLEEYLEKDRALYNSDFEPQEKKGPVKNFLEVCSLIYDEFRKEWEHSSEKPEKLLALQKKAITGCAPEAAFFKKKIREYLLKHRLETTEFPSWYSSLEEAVYHENWGVAAVAEWFSERYSQSSSAKIIGERIYFLENGKMMLKPQKISEARREQLIRSFLMLTPEERLDKDFHEVYLLDGTRITIFRRQMVKKGQDVIIFRRYIIPSYTFEEQAARGTIPPESIPLFKAMAGLGYWPLQVQ